MYYYSPSAKGFYDSEFNTTIPDDAISISDVDYRKLHSGLAEGKQIHIINSVPTLVDPKVVITWEEVRSKRNNLLNRSDFTQLLDYPGNKVAWAEYRQQLRDIPEKFSDPNEVIWPLQPK